MQVHGVEARGAAAWSVRYCARQGLGRRGVTGAIAAASPRHGPRVATPNCAQHFLPPSALARRARAAQYFSVASAAVSLNQPANRLPRLPDRVFDRSELRVPPSLSMRT